MRLLDQAGKKDVFEDKVATLYHWNLIEKVTM